jgi:5-methylcytosine-specific restriction endonuclease McrA
MESIPQRTCNKCKKSFPRTPEFWHKHKGHPDGLASICKECAKAKARQWVADNRERNRESCAEYYASHKQEAREYQKRNAEHLREIKRAWNEAHPEKVRRYWKESIARHPERKRQQKSASQKRNREAARVRGRRYAKRHPEKIRIGCLNRWAMFKAAEGQFTKQDIDEIYETQQGRCAYCGITLHGVYEIDHVIPLSRGGSNWPDNLMITCPSCNSSKNNYLLDEWKERRDW